MTKPGRVTVLAAVGLAAMAVIYLFPPVQYRFYPRCPIYSATHLLCPGCGGTRALYELLHLNLAGALHYNALLTVLAPAALGWLSVCSIRAVFSKRSVEFRLPLSFAIGLAVVAVLFTVLRNSGLAFAI